MRRVIQPPNKCSNNFFTPLVFIFVFCYIDSSIFIATTELSGEGNPMTATMPERSDISAPLRALDELRALSSRFRALTATSWSAEPAGDTKEAVVVLEDVIRFATFLRSQVIAEVDRSASWQKDGQRKVQTWVRDLTGSSDTTAAKEVALARALADDLPHTRDALANAEISEDHAHVLARECTKSEELRNRLKDPIRGEAALLEQAKRMNAADFQKKAKQWAVQEDPKGADKQWRKDSKKEELHVVQLQGGCRVTGWLTTSNGAILAEALESHMGRKAADDTRTYPERNAAALLSMAQQGLNAGLQLPYARIRPQLLVNIDFDTLRGLVEASASSMPEGATDPSGGTDSAAWAAAWQPGDDHVIDPRLDYERLKGIAPALLPDGSPLAPSELARIACSSTLNRVIFGPDSVVLNAGRDQRLFDSHQTKAIIARDRHCQYPGCDEPPNRCEAHHSMEWLKHRGDTDVELGLLLCWHHHSLIHRENTIILRTRGKWIFKRSNGTIIHPPGSNGTLEPDATMPPGTAPPATRQPDLFQEPGPPF